MDHLNHYFLFTSKYRRHLQTEAEKAAYLERVLWPMSQNPSTPAPIRARLAPLVAEHERLHA